MLIVAMKGMKDYCYIIDELSDVAFSAFVEYFYPLCNYQFIQKQNIRRVDVKEALLKYDRNVPLDRRGEKRDIIEYYLEVLYRYFTTFLKCKNDSRPERYYNRAIKIIKEFQSGENEIQDMEDVVIIFTRREGISYFNCSWSCDE